MEKKLGDGLFRLLAPSVAGLLACVVCLCATSWAWFSASVTAAATTIRSASYTVEISVSPDATLVAVTEEAGVYSVKFPADGDYTIILTRTGNASTGYCKVKFRNVEYCTGQLTAEAPELQFTVHAEQDESLTITPTWGEYTGSEFKPLAALSSPTNDPVETEPPEGDTNTAEPADQPDGEDESESTGETKQPDETDQPDENLSGDSGSTTPEGNTLAEGELGTNTGDSAPASDISGATTPETPAPAAPAAPADASESGN